MILAAQNASDPQTGDQATPQQVEIITYDGNEFIGEIVTENEQEIVIKTLSGITLTIPKIRILKRNKFQGKVIEGKIWKADPNKSMYIFAPSAFPIEDNKSYCRDFCLFFPSYNRGFGNTVSVQLGAFWFPGMTLGNTPLVGSIKMSLPSFSIFQFAGGIMYVRLPSFGFNDDDSSIGMGFTFVTGTIGDNFTHASASLGWGYTQHEGDWAFLDDPILVLAGNYRINDSFALIYEGWFFPKGEINNQPMMGSLRFLGKRFSFDFGGLFILNMEGLPFPIINFAYYLN